MKGKNVAEVIGSAIGTATSATGTAMQTSEVLQIISIVITIIGGLITIALGIRAWWKDAKKDGKIDKEEVDELLDIVGDGVEKIKDATRKGEKDK